MLWKDKAQEQESNTRSYLRMLLRAIRKLSRTKPQTLYRGIKEHKQKYTVGEELLWKGFSSTSTSMEATRTFLTSNDTGRADGTLFEIRGMWGYRISDFSVFEGEQEVLLEPMLKFTVKDVKEQDGLTFVVVEPLEQSLLLSDEIPTGCIQHIVLALESGKDSKETCARLCNILSNVCMDDYNSPDSRRMFKDYGGFKLLCKLFEKHRDLNITMALAHVVDKNYCIRIFFFTHFSLFSFATACYSFEQKCT